MAQPSYNIKDVYGAIYKINNYFDEINNGGVTFDKTDGLLHKYCHYRSKSGSDKCRDYLEKASSGVIHLLQTLKDKRGLECDKLAEYAILWLRYKLNMHTQYKSTNLNTFYTNHIEKNEYYNEKINDSGNMTYKDIINTKKDLMNMNNNEISKFNYPFSILCLFYNKIKANKLDCTNYSSYLKTIGDRFKELNKNSNNKEGSSYKKLLSTLSDDYNHLKNNYGNNSCNFPPIPELTPKKMDAKNTVVNSLESSGQPTALSSEVTSSSSSISTTLIPGLSTFSVIPVFLGIAYKYSLFGVDKLFQRQYIRKKLKKVKKKMKLNI
ncbi:CIR protein PIR protein [Plasmodium vinckei brucechwatti]|uniref:CIR protein PIR protein n=1 Tax=Plasmodium vinckei brucechwatti TaxID=119398 RepID=A0A6V7RWR4_PLAVN|nr:CIR protein PIR protein [Plasmodium vinckei brucechwatti]